METKNKKKIGDTYDKFKSYYVVWKLVLAGARILVSYGFKSYYVVWKPANPKQSLQDVFGLNRTM